MDIYNLPTENFYLAERKIGFLSTCQKWFLVFVNCILFTIGLAQIGIGFYVLASNTGIWIGSYVPALAVGLGMFVTMISFLGCCGAARENRCMLCIYAFFLFWIILAETSGLTVFFFGGEYIRAFLSSCWNNLSLNDMSKIQDDWKCCSFDGNSADATQTDQEAYAICLQEHPTWTQSCWEMAHENIEKNINSIYVADAIVVSTQIIFFFMTFGLINGITVSYIYDRISIIVGV